MGGGPGTGGTSDQSPATPEALTRNFPRSAGCQYMRLSLSGWLSHGRELKGERPPNRWLLGQHRLRDAQEKISTVLSATKYEGISGYVTQVKNNLIFKNKKSETTNCEHDETECCAHPEQGSEATRFLGEKKVFFVLSPSFTIVCLNVEVIFCPFEFTRANFSIYGTPCDQSPERTCISTLSHG